jgi:glycosyltransferase involved in cell wall biosynthesis
MAGVLRIAQIAPISTAITADSTGSIEQLVSLLTSELVRRGHDVTLFAAGTSRTPAKLHAIYPRGYDEDERLWDWEFHEIMNAAAAFEAAADFDVIHSHVYHFALPFTRLVDIPVVHSYHVLPNTDIVLAYERYPDARLVAVSEYQRKKLQSADSGIVVHHGIDVRAFPFNPVAGDYLLFLGRMQRQKGPLEAIQVAQRVGMRLVLAGPADAADRKDPDYFANEVSPLIDGSTIRHVGAVGPERRNELLSGAAALLYTATAGETFGLVMVEAMACGTPVAALQHGAVPEIVKEGVTGYSASSVDALARRMPEVLALDRTRVRQEAERRFDYHRMVDDYEVIYRRMVESRPTPARMGKPVVEGQPAAAQLTGRGPIHRGPQAHRQPK